MVNRPGEINGVGADWRACTAKARTTVPQWLTAARTMMQRAGFVPSAEQIAMLAKQIKNLNIKLSIGGEEFAAEGLISKLGKLSRTEAFTLLIRIAENGWQETPVALAFEEASPLRGFGSIQLDRLLDVLAVRAIAADLENAWVRITMGCGPKKDTLIHKVGIADLYVLRQELEPRLNGESLNGVLTFWRTEVMAPQNFPSGRYALTEIISEMA